MARVSAEKVDIVLHPLEGEMLVQQACIYHSVPEDFITCEKAEGPKLAGQQAAGNGRDIPTRY